MARKDVELVIRAKNEASKALDSVGEMLKALATAQQEVAAGSGKTESALDRLGTALGSLNTKFKGLSVVDKVKSDFSAATAAADRLEKQVASLASESQRLATESEQAAAATAKLRDETDKSAGSLERQKKTVKDTRAAQKELNAALTEASAERARLAASDRSMVDQIERLDAAIEKQTAKVAKLGAEMSAVENPSKTLQTSFAKATESLDKKQAKLDEVTQKYIANRAATEAAAVSVTNIQMRLGGVTEALEREKAALTQSAQAHTELKSAVKTSASHQKELEGSAEQTADALVREQAALEKARTSVAEMAPVVAKSTQEQMKMASVIRGTLVGAYAEQVAKVAQMQEAWKQAEGAVGNLARAMKGVENPSKALTDAFDRAKTAAATAKAEYIQSRDTVQALGPALQQAGGNFDRLVATQQRFSGALSGTASSLAATRGATVAVAQAQGAIASAANSAASSVKKVGDDAKGTAGDLQEASRETFGFASALRSLYGESRMAMSWTQRLRGEVLSLITAYAGMQGAIDLIKQVVNAYTSLEGAQSRLNVVFNGDQSKTGEELDWLRRSANRLGIEFNTLANEYSKFAVATQGTNLEGAKTRKIFLSVAEAARVNKTSLEDMQGMFTALTQIVSKDAVQMEELRQQLGDRLPGAVQLMAAALGVGTQELLKMMANGEVTADALIGFATQLDKKFGAQLPKALESTTTAIGQLQNGATNALRIIANSGFIEHFTQMIRDLSTVLASADAEAFFRRLGAAMGAIFDLVGALAKNFDLVAMALMAFVGVKATPFILALGTSIKDLALGLVALPGKFSAASTAARTSAASVGVLQASVIGLRAALAALMSSTGIGLLVTAVSIAVGEWATRADKATEAMNSHQKIVDEVKDAYDRATDSTAKWADGIAKGSKTQAIANLQKFREVLADIKDEARAPVDAFGTDTTGVTRQLADVVEKFKTGQMSAADFKKSVDDIAQANPQLDRGIILQLLNLGDTAKDAESKVKSAEALLRILDGTATDTDKALFGLKGKTQELSTAMDGAAGGGLKKFEEGLNKIKALIPELANEMKRLKAIAELDDLANALNPKTVGEFGTVLENYSRARGAINQQAAENALKEIAGNTKITTTMLKTIIGSEGYRSQAYKDQGGTPTIGFGSTRIHGRAVQMGDQITEQEAYNQMVKDIAVFAGEVDGLVKVPITENMRAALTSYAYNVGHVSQSIIDKVNAQDWEGAAQAIRDGVSTVNGHGNAALKQRRQDEAALFSTPGTAAEDYDLEKAKTEEIRKQAEEKAKQAEKDAQEREKQRAGTAERVAESQFDIQQQELINAGKGRQAAIENAIREAKKKDPGVTEEEIAKLTEQEGKLYDLKHAQDAVNAAKKEAEASEKVVNDLMTLRQQLMQQMQLYAQTGNSAGLEEAKVALEGVNAQLDGAIQKAIQMWQAVGGAPADAAIAKLKTTQLTIQAGAQQSFLDWNRVGQLFASGLTNAFDSFAQAVAEGQDVGEAARNAFLKFASDFLKQIAQMIIQQAILNMLRSFFPGMGFGGVGAGVAHDGGIAGSSNRTRTVDPGIFANAVRYHGGGIAGLAPNEVPAVLERGEEILTRADPRHRLNLGNDAVAAGPGAAPAGGGTKIINAFDTASFLEEALNSRVGERAILNFVRANPGAFKQAVNGG
jgi:tape measure domain-containing protein